MDEEKEQQAKSKKKAQAAKFAKQTLKVAAAPVKMTGKIVGTILVNVVSYAILLVVVLLVVSKFLLPSFGSFIGDLSPMKKQAEAIEKRNNTKDAFSAIKGSSTSVIPDLDAVQWVTGKNKQCTIWLPKLTNESPIFKDDKEQELLYQAFGYSVNREFLDEEFQDWNVYYDGHLVAEPSTDGETVKVYSDVSEKQETLVKKELKEIISKQNKYPKVKDWEETFEAKKLSNGNYKISVAYDAQHLLSLVSKKIVDVTVEVDFSNAQPKVVQKTMTYKERK
jgi:hypothetical protein